MNRSHWPAQYKDDDVLVDFLKLIFPFLNTFFFLLVFFKFILVFLCVFLCFKEKVKE